MGPIVASDEDENSGPSDDGGDEAPGGGETAGDAPRHPGGDCGEGKWCQLTSVGVGAVGCGPSTTDTDGYEVLCHPPQGGSKGEDGSARAQLGVLAASRALGRSVVLAVRAHQWG